MEYLEGFQLKRLYERRLEHARQVAKESLKQRKAHKNPDEIRATPVKP
jgi:hypothetical protein